MILIIGGSGFLGYNLHQQLVKGGGKVISTFFNNSMNIPNFQFLNVADKEHVVEFIHKINPDTIICSSALTNVDLCEKDQDLAKSVNVDGISNVIDAAKNTKSKIVLISTSAVFDGSKNPYLETDTPNPISYYGLTKLLSEQAVINSGLSNLIIRTDQPYSWKESWHHTNSVLRVIENISSGRDHPEITDWYNTPTYVPDFVSCVIKLLNLNYTGIFNIVGSDFVNRFEFATVIAEIFHLDKNRIKPITSKDLALPAQRANVKLDNKKAFEKTGIVMSNIYDGLRKMKKSKII